MDKLKECAVKFKYLLDIEYKMILGRKGKTTHLNLDFDPHDFYHLVGLQKLEDLPYLRKDREIIFQQILNEEITYNMITKSLFFEKNEEKNILGIRARIDGFTHIIEILDSNNIYFKYNSKNNKSSYIKAIYLVEYRNLNNTIYVFADKRDYSEKIYCKSFFPKELQDYTLKQTKMTLLYKEKINKRLNENIIQFDRFNK